MKKLNFLFLIIFTGVFFNNMNVQAKIESVSYSNSNFMHSIETSEWSLSNDADEDGAIRKQWDSDCGSIYVRISDSDDNSKEEKISDLIDDTDDTAEGIIQSLYDETENNIKIESHSFKKYNMEFYYVKSTSDHFNVDSYVGYDEGNFIFIDYVKENTNTNTCNFDIENLLSTAMNIQKYDKNHQLRSAVTTFVISFVLFLIIPLILFVMKRTINYKILFINNFIISLVYFIYLTSMVTDPSTKIAILILTALVSVFINNFIFNRLLVMRKSI